MVAGYDKYFQIVRCFATKHCGSTAARIHADRHRAELLQPGRRVRDGREAVVRDLESRPRRRSESALPERPFSALGFEDAMRDYGNDKPDLRFAMKHVDLTEMVVTHGGGGIPFWQPLAEKFKSGPTARICRRRSSRRCWFRRALTCREPKGQARAGGQEHGRRGSRARRSDRTVLDAVAAGEEHHAGAPHAINTAHRRKEGDLILFQSGKNRAGSHGDGETCGCTWARSSA
jgi:aspartyl-tRNA synthetase